MGSLFYGTNIIVLGKPDHRRVEHFGASTIKKRSVIISGHSTSVSLENAFWLELKELVARRGTTINKIISEIDNQRGGNLSSSIRVYVLKNLKQNVY